MAKPIKTFLYCEFDLIRDGLNALLDNEKSIKLIKDIIPKEEILKSVPLLNLDVFVIELAILKSTGLSFIKDIHKIDPAIRFIILSRNEKEPFISKCIEAGALGYISLNCSQNELVEAIQTVSLGNKYLSQDVAYDFAISRLNQDSDCVLQLTEREYQVFTMLAQGLAVKKIAQDMCLSPKTIHVYRSNIMKKFDVNSVPELTIFALKQGLITIDLVG